jgi:hypothetical protein
MASEVVRGKANVGVNGLIYRRQMALTPNHEAAGAVISLPPREFSAANRTINRRIGLVAVEHTHWVRYQITGILRNTGRWSVAQAGLSSGGRVRRLGRV